MLVSEVVPLSFCASSSSHLTFVVVFLSIAGGSLGYANTLPLPRDDFFTASSWSRFADWKKELAPHYKTVARMLGAAENPKVTRADEVVREIAAEIGRAKEFGMANVSVFFGEPDKTVPDPYFDGAGPERSGCNFCGGCMVGCRYNAKNTLDKNYLWLAEKCGARIEPEMEVTWVNPHPDGGYEITALQGELHGL